MDKIQLVDGLCELKRVERSDLVDTPDYNSSKKTIDSDTDKNSEQQNVSTSEGYKVNIELMVHPGYPSDSGDQGCGSGADEFACSSARKHELDTLRSKQLFEWYVTESITLISRCTD